MDVSLEQLKNNLVDAVEAFNEADESTNEKILKGLEENVNSKMHSILFRLKRDK